MALRSHDSLRVSAHALHVVLGVGVGMLVIWMARAWVLEWIVPLGHKIPQDDMCLDYMKGVGQVADLTRKIEAAAAGLGEGDLKQKKAELEAELASLRARLSFGWTRKP